MNRGAAGRRRVVLATDVAETSITVPDIVYVVDCGMVRGGVLVLRLVNTRDFVPTRGGIRGGGPAEVGGMAPTLPAILCRAFHSRVHVFGSATLYLLR